jgi:hypothetical protein
MRSGAISQAAKSTGSPPQQGPNGTGFTSEYENPGYGNTGYGNTGLGTAG